MPPRTPVPDPADAGTLAPMFVTWPATKQMIRCHQTKYGACEFNPGPSSGRFSPFRDSHGDRVPRIYAAETFAAALSESVFHDLPLTGPGRMIAKSKLETVQSSTIHAMRDLNLVQLFGQGLDALQLTRAQLIETEAAHYNQTVDWAKALHDHADDIDGLIWMSRLYSDSQAMVIFGSRVDRGDLNASVRPEPLAAEPTFTKVQEIATNNGIVITA